MAENQELLGYQRSYLLKLAHRVKPTVMVGQKGYGDAVVKMADKELEIHELIKIKFQDFKEEKRKISEELARATRSSLVRVIGNIAILYRMQRDPEKRMIVLPQRTPGRKPAVRD